MPPEQWSWDRKEPFFRDRKHERPEPLGFPGPPEFRRTPGDRKEFYFKDRRYERFDPIGPPPVRWRDSYHHNNYPRNFHRWGGSPDFRRPPGGFGKQGGWHMFNEEPGNGYGPSRSSERFVEGDGFRPYVYRGNGRYSSRNGRDNRSSFSQREWRGGNSLETTNGSPSVPGRMNVIGGDRRSADNVSTHPDLGSEKIEKSNQVHSKDQQDKSNGFNGTSPCHNFDRENREKSPVSTDWKPLKWTRSGSLSSRALGFSHSSCTKGTSGDDSNEGRADSQKRNTNQVESPSADATACVTSAVPAEETASQRKHRLGWGEGLAKYEKKKVEGTDESERNGCVIASTNLEPVHSVFSNLADKSPRIAGLSDCASPATPSSVACSSSTGLDEKLVVKPSNADNDISKSCSSLGPLTFNVEEFSFELEKLDFTVNDLGTSLSELLQSDWTVSADSNFVRSTAMNKVLVLKGDLLKDLEITESRVDSLENELKSLNSDAVVNDSYVPVLADDTKSSREHTAGHAIPHSDSLQIVCSGDVIVDKMPLSDAPLPSDRKEDVDSPGSATSKLSEHLYFENAAISSDKGRDGSVSLSVLSPDNVEAKGSACVSLGGGTSASADLEGMHPETDNGDSVSDYINKEDDLYKLILTSNKELAAEASEEIFKLLPKDLCKSYMLGPNDLSCLQNVSAIKEKFVVKKRLHSFKERLLAIKFQTLQHLWKHDLALPPLKKSLAKSQKKIESGLRTVQSGCQKRRSSIRSHATSLARNLALVPTSEVVHFTRKLLLDSQPKMCRNSLKMPEQILDKEERIASRFMSSNGLIEDPVAIERERGLINTWTLEEKETFIDKLAIFGKNFRKIASFLVHKTTADCVEFYYKNHKSDCFAKTKKHDLRKQVKSSASAYLLTSQKRRDHEMNNAASLNMLRTASMIASDADDSAFKQQSSDRLFLSGRRESKATHVDNSITELKMSYDNFGTERESVAADVLAGMSGSLSSEAMTSCISSSVDCPKNGILMYQKMGKRKRPWTPCFAENVDETGSDESCEEMRYGDWTDREKSVFIKAITLYGKDFAAISRLIKTKSHNQCKVYFSKARKCLGLDQLCADPGVVKPSVSDDADDSGSDVEDGCAVETGLGEYRDNMGFKMETEIVPSPVIAKHFGPGFIKKMKMEPDVKFIRSNGTDWAEHRDVKAVETLITNASSQSKQKSNSNKLYDRCKTSKALRSEKIVNSLVDSGVGKVQQFNQGRLVAVSSFNETTDPVVSSSDSVNVETLVTETARDGAGKDVELSESLILENHVNESQDGTSNTDADSPCSQGVEKEPSTTKHSLETRFRQEHQQRQVISDFNTVGQPAAYVKRESSFASGNSLAQHSGMVREERINVSDRSSSTLDRQENKDEERHNVSRDGNKLDDSEQSPCHHLAESSSTLQGHPQSSAESKMNGEFNGERSEVHNLDKYKRSFISQSSEQDCCLKRCGNSKFQSLTSDRVQKPEQTSCNSPPVRNFSDSEKPSRVSDVRLFGKIICSTPHEQPTTEIQKSDERINQPIGSKSSKLKSPFEENADVKSAILRFDQDSRMGHDNLPTGNFEYWNRLQPSFSTMPDSAMLLSKYPAAFCNFTALPSQKQQFSVGTSSHRFDGTCLKEMNGTCLKEMNGNGAVDFQVYRAQDATKVQPFTVGMMQCEEMYSQMQRYNGLDAMSALPQHENGLVGMDILGRVGACHTVQDPVTAIRMQYAKADQYGGQTGGSNREEPSWRGKGV